MKFIKFIIRAFLKLLILIVQISFALLQFILGFAMVIFTLGIYTPKRRNYY